MTRKQTYNSQNFESILILTKFNYTYNTDVSSIDRVDTTLISNENGLLFN